MPDDIKHLVGSGNKIQWDLDAALVNCAEYNSLPTMIFQQILCGNKILHCNDVEKEAYLNIGSGKDLGRK